MSNVETALNLASKAQDLTRTVEQRRHNWETLIDLKRRAKVSFAKLRISDEMLANIQAALEVRNEERVAKRRGAKISDTRVQALELLANAGDVSRADKIKLLVESMNMSRYNASYYVDRVLRKQA